MTREESIVVHPFSTWPKRVSGSPSPSCSGCCCCLWHRDKKGQYPLEGVTQRGKQCNWSTSAGPGSDPVLPPPGSSSRSALLQQWLVISLCKWTGRGVYPPLNVSDSWCCTGSYFMPLPSFPFLRREREYGHECDPSMLSTNAYPTFTFRVCMLWGASDRSANVLAFFGMMVLGRKWYLHLSIPQDLGFYLYHAAAWGFFFSTAFQAECPGSCWCLESSEISALPTFPLSFFIFHFHMFHLVLLAFQHRMLTRISLKWSLNSLHPPLSGLWGKEWIDQNEK